MSVRGGAVTEAPTNGCESSAAIKPIRRCHSFTLGQRGSSKLVSRHVRLSEAALPHANLPKESPLAAFATFSFSFPPSSNSAVPGTTECMAAPPPVSSIAPENIHRSSLSSDFQTNQPRASLATLSGLSVSETLGSSSGLFSAVGSRLFGGFRPHLAPSALEASLPNETPRASIRPGDSPGVAHLQQRYDFKLHPEGAFILQLAADDTDAQSRSLQEFDYLQGVVSKPNASLRDATGHTLRCQDPEDVKHDKTETNQLSKNAPRGSVVVVQPSHTESGRISGVKRVADKENIGRARMVSSSPTALAGKSDKHLEG
eukprot:GHVT01087196.1.p1 GENE.GHVT01087196.1~~GHVT01087196.1.p1  ORF type:complete len:315 (-),score=49.93 GHVT01087196.1:73-1017(-)